MAADYVKNLILKAYQEKATFLDLGRCGLTDIPEEIIILSPFLEELNLGNYYVHENIQKSPINNFGPNDFSNSMASFTFLESFTNLISLHLLGIKLREQQINHISSLNSLTNLDVSYNVITDDSANSISRLNNLKKLRIGKTNISYKGVKAISTLGNLTHLEIGGLNESKITDREAESIGKLCNLTYLDIAYNQITDVGAKSISKLSNLTYLDVGYNAITDQGVKYITILSSLTSLDIEHNEITDKGAEFISRLCTLTTLRISENQITNRGAESISKLFNLTDLVLRYNKISFKGAEFLSGLFKLTKLDILSNQIGDKGANSIYRLTNLTELNIANNQLTYKGTKSIHRLTKLIKLNISFNKIADRGVEFIYGLDNLTDLDIRSNQMTDIAAHSISKLRGLKDLQIGENQFTDKGVESLATLVNLKNLYLHSNQVGDKGAEIISHLVNLTRLGINSNQLTDIGAKYVSKLKNLTSLGIGSNQITDNGVTFFCRLKKLTSLDIPGIQITKKESIKLILKKLPKLSSLTFYWNEMVDIPKELMYDVDGLRAYFASSEKVNNTLVKMILIGNTTTGKSSFADYLINKHFDSDRKSTHGIKLWRWETRTKKSTLKVNIWDFGGQDYYHSTHNLFLNYQSLFLLIHTPKEIHCLQKNDNLWFPINYWLGNIRSLTSDNSIIWYISSKTDLGKTDVMETKWIEQYNVENQFKISIRQTFENNKSSQRDFRYFIEMLTERLENFAIGKLPVSWVEIRDIHLPRWRQKNLYLSSLEFKRKCAEALRDNSIFLKDLNVSWNGLLPYLIGCGEIIYFEKNAALSNMIFLSAEKLTMGIYQVVLTEKVFRNKGIFEIEKVLKKNERNAKLYVQILMAYGLIFEKPGKNNEYVIPQYLPENPYEEMLRENIDLALVMHFPDYMPSSIINQFIVKYAYNEDEKNYWRYGARFLKNGIAVLVKFDIEKQKIFIHAKRDKSSSYLETITELFLFFASKRPTYLEDGKNEWNANEILTEYHKIKGNTIQFLVQGSIELSVNNIDFVTAKEIKTSLQFKARNIRTCDGIYISMIPLFLHLLPTGIGISKKIFLSYSHKDEEYKKELDTHFAALKRTGKVETWHDRKLMPGTEWSNGIEEALLNSDIVLLLLSPDFMASDYIWNIEIPKAVEIGVLIVPIFLRPCDFKESIFKLYRKQGLPIDTKWIVNTKNQFRDEAYLEVIEGIKKLLE